MIRDTSLMEYNQLQQDNGSDSDVQCKVRSSYPSYQTLFADDDLSSSQNTSGSQEAHVKRIDPEKTAFNTCVFSDDQIKISRRNKLIYVNSQKRRIQYNYPKTKKSSAPKYLNLQVEGLKVSLHKQKPASIAVPFTEKEDQKILKLVLEHGPKFQKIHRLIKGKTISMVKNRYYKNLRYRWDQVLGSEYQHLNAQAGEYMHEEQ